MLWYTFKIETFYTSRMVTLKFGQNPAISLCSFCMLPKMEYVCSEGLRDNKAVLEKHTTLLKFRKRNDISCKLSAGR